MTVKDKQYKNMPITQERSGVKSYASGVPLFNSTITTDDIPVNPSLQNAFSVLSDGDESPFFFVSEMKLGEDYPAKNGDIMTVEWAESFVSALDRAPFPISALGHTNVDRPMERVESHGYVVGGAVIDDSLYLKNYLAKGDSQEAQALYKKTVKEMKAGMLATSVSNYQRELLVIDSEKNISKWYVIESITGQRNDIVEHDLTGADAAIVARSMKASINADASAKKNTGEQSMDKTQMLDKLRTLKSNGEISLDEIAGAVGVELVKDEHKKAVSVLNSVIEIIGDGDVIEKLKALKEQAAKVEEAAFLIEKTNALAEAFKDEELRKFAEELFSLKCGDAAACKEETERIARLSVMKRHAENLAKEMSGGASFATESVRQASLEKIEL